MDWFIIHINSDALPSFWHVPGILGMIWGCLETWNPPETPLKFPSWGYPPILRRYPCLHFGDDCPTCFWAWVSQIVFGDDFNVFFCGRLGIFWDNVSCSWERFSRQGETWGWCRWQRKKSRRWGPLDQSMDAVREGAGCGWQTPWSPEFLRKQQVVETIWTF